MNAKNVLENLIGMLSSEISMIKQIILSVETQLEQLEEVSFELEDKKAK